MRVPPHGNGNSAAVCVHLMEPELWNEEYISLCNINIDAMRKGKSKFWEFLEVRFFDVHRGGLVSFRFVFVKEWRQARIKQCHSFGATGDKKEIIIAIIV